MERPDGVAPAGASIPRSRVWAILALALTVVAAAAVSLVSGRSGPPPDPLSALTSTSGSRDWVMHQRDPGHSGYVSGPAPAFEAGIKWQFLSRASITASPAVAAGMVYLGTGDGRVVALRAADGALDWEYPVDDRITAAPAVAGAYVVLGLRDSRVIALDRETGALQWAFRTGGPIIGAPVVKDGVVYVANGIGRLYAIDVVTGTLFWQFEIRVPIGSSERVRSSPAISDHGKIVFGSQDGNIYVVDAVSGQSDLVYPTGADVDSSPVILGRRAYVGTSRGALIALDTQERNRIFDRQSLRVKGQLFVWSVLSSPPRPRGHVWSSRLTSSPIVSTPAIAGGILVAAAGDGGVHALDRGTGRKLWSFHTEAESPTSPAVAGGTIYVGAGDGTVKGLDITTGRPLWEWASPMGMAPSTSPVIADGVLYVAASQERPEVSVFQAGDPGAPPVERPGYYYRHGTSPCAPDPVPPAGPFATYLDAQTRAFAETSACGVLYALG